MKRIFLIIAVTTTLVTTSCKQEYENWYSAAYELSGEWIVTVTAVDANGAVVYEDDELFGIGSFELTTYNTAANSATEMWIDDNYHFWEFKVKTGINVDSKTFNVNNAGNTYYDDPSDCLVTIKDGKILPGAATSPGGNPTDSIVFIVSFSDDPYPGMFGYDAYRISGYRKTGFLEDE